MPAEPSELFADPKAIEDQIAEKQRELAYLRRMLNLSKKAQAARMEWAGAYGQNTAELDKGGK